ncbi:MAG: hypothetical protein EA378_06325 [Phycisphaerales bacterium]|nr:MAG: hypothetical protein EA378_06325 [Phycisphaerales bacterium]
MPNTTDRCARVGLTGRLALVALLAASGVTLLGCKSPAGEREARSLRYNLNPELYTLTDRPADVRNTWAIIRSENTRMLREDVHRVLMIDRQSRLTRAPIPR